MSEQTALAVQRDDLKSDAMTRGVSHFEGVEASRMRSQALGHLADERRLADARSSREQEVRSGFA